MRKPSDARDKLDLVYRKGPISLGAMMAQCSVYSENEIYDALTWGEKNGIVSCREGELQKDGTTTLLWEWEGWNDV